MGWFGDCSYILTNGKKSLRITRFRNEDRLEVAYRIGPREEGWIGIAELMVALGAITFDDAMSGAVPHDLEFQLASFTRIRPEIEARLGPDPTTHEALVQVRQESKEFARWKYGLTFVNPNS
jgi:hypothetical protein